VGDIRHSSWSALAFTEDIVGLFVILWYERVVLGLYEGIKGSLLDKNNPKEYGLMQNTGNEIV